MNRVIHFEIQADDPGRAKKFYEKTFGWKIDLAMEKSKGGPMDYWLVTTGDKNDPGINGGLYERPSKEEWKHNFFHCTIDVPDIDKAIEEVKKNGGKILPIEGKEKSHLETVGWFASCKDSEGNNFSIMQSEMEGPM